MKPRSNGRGDVRRFFLRRNFRYGALRAISLGVLFICVATSASSDSTREPVIHPLQNANFASHSDIPCLSTALEAGDPDTGPSAVLVKMEKGCIYSWHFHTAVEEII